MDGGTQVISFVSPLEARRNAGRVGGARTLADPSFHLTPGSRSLTSPFSEPPVMLYRSPSGKLMISRYTSAREAVDGLDATRTGSDLLRSLLTIQVGKPLHFECRQMSCCLDFLRDHPLATAYDSFSFKIPFAFSLSFLPSRFLSRCSSQR